MPTRSPEELVQEVLDSGYPERILAIAEEYTPGFDRLQARRTAASLAAELNLLGVRCPPSSITDLILLQAMTLPVGEDGLALALSRLFVCAAIIDDASGHDLRLPFQVLGSDDEPRSARSSLYAGCAYRMFEGIAAFCDRQFLGVSKSLYRRSLIGVVFEHEFSADVADGIDTEYVRRASGFAEFWSTLLQFVDPCLDFCANLRFWAAALRPMADFLNEFNDVLSFYKEAMDGRDLVWSKPYRTAVLQGISYLDAYRQALDLGVRSYQQVLDLADDRQRPYLDNYMKGYIYWHTHTARYRWKDLFPAIRLMDIEEMAGQAVTAARAH